MGLNLWCTETLEAQSVPPEMRAERREESSLIDDLVKETRHFLEREVDSAAVDQRARIEPETIAAAADLGLFGITIPAAYGGLGLSLRAACRIISEIAAIDRSLAITVGLHAGLGTRGLVEAGSREAKTEWLPMLATGTTLAAFGATEPGAGSDLTAVSTRGRPVPGGLVVDGEKSYVTNGGFAGLFTVLVRTPSAGGRRTFSLVLIPRDTPGVSIGCEEQKLGIRGSSTVSLHLNDVFVPERHVLGASGRGLETMGNVLAWGRTLLAAGCIGTAKSALSAAVRHVTERRQFGHTIGEFPSTRRQIADMAAALYAMNALVAWIGEESASARDILRASALAKVFCSETAFAVVDRTLQLHGALGFLEPTGIARLLRDVRVTRIFEGANEVLLVREGADRISRFNAAGGGVVPAVFGDSHPRLAGIVKLWRHHHTVFGRMLGRARTKLGVRVVSHQTLLQAVARAGICLDVSAAVIYRADRPNITADELLLAEHAVCRQLAEVKVHLGEAVRAATDEDRELALSDVLYSEDKRATSALHFVHR